MSDTPTRRDMFAPKPPADDAPGEVLAWYGEYQRAALLLETLAEDHFPDQASFEAWIQRQNEINLGRR